ncbi:MAG: hypothetical protein FWF71_05645 [Actinomycetia bacterium]|nr:hypothetical protein [Actinomycetes bacterium]
MPMDFEYRPDKWTPDTDGPEPSVYEDDPGQWLSDAEGQGNSFGPAASTAIVLLIVLVVLIIVGLNAFSKRLDSSQASFLEMSVRRAAVACYALEGSFPTNAQGIGYLQENYGLMVDKERYIVYYEYLGANLLPQIKVYPYDGDADQSVLIGEALGSQQFNGLPNPLPNASAQP